jgi:membrane-associated phospholipid phosphatase
LIRAKIATSRALLLVVVSVIMLATPVSIFLGDQPVIEYLHARESASIIGVAALMGDLANPIPYFASSAVVLILARFQRSDRLTANRALFMLLASGAAGTWADILKGVFGRSRPYLYFDQHVHGFHPFANDQSFASFPSEHAAVATAVAATCSLFLPDYRSTFILLALIVAASRVAIGVHYPNDVLAGLLLGLAVVMVLTVVFERLKLRLRRSQEIWKSGPTPGES